jgi:hypothetical protein
MDKKFYVYIHYKVDTDEPFYVGKGSGNRAKVKSQRSSWWKRIVEKHGYYIEILESFNTEAEAFNRERSLIASMKAAGINLCNMTNGGDGAAGRVLSASLREQIASKQRNVPRPQTARDNHPLFKGVIQATHIITGDTIHLVGNADMANHGFNPSNVSKCLKGKRPHSKGYTFKRI